MLNNAQKTSRLARLSEDEFRDQIVRELFLAQGFRSYRDVCGADEEGKDCVLFKDAEFGKIACLRYPDKDDEIEHVLESDK
ncbi:MAG: hypothetical protein ABL949_11670 [Fimbriimonadaceae bacterium]